MVTTKKMSTEYTQKNIKMCYYRKSTQKEVMEEMKDKKATRHTEYSIKQHIRSSQENVTRFS